MFYDGTVESKRILYTPSRFAKKSLLYLQETGCLTATKPHVSRHENLPSYLFFLVESGSGTLEYLHKTYPLSEGDCVFIDCEKPYAHMTDTTRLWTLRWVHFYGESLPGIYEKYTERGGQPVFRPSELSCYTALTDRLFDIASSDDYLRDMRINEMLAGLLTKIMETSWHPEKQTDERRGAERKLSIQNVKEYLDENHTKKITLDGLAERFYINKFYLARLYRERYGMSVIGYILNLRITDAKKKLRFTDQSVEKISYECGFEDANYFARVFKKAEGMSPMEFRKKWR